MEIIRGKTSREMDAAELAERLAGHRRVLVDLGTGDGRFVRHLSETQPGAFVIGVDACRENLRAASREKRANTLFVIANALSLPHELRGLASQLTINFPWGSLLDGLLDADRALLDGLAALTRPGTLLEVRLNMGALAEAGRSPKQGVRDICNNLLAGGFRMEPPILLEASGLRSFPTTWAKRLSFGRDPRAVALYGVWPAFEPVRFQVNIKQQDA